LFSLELPSLSLFNCKRTTGINPVTRPNLDKYHNKKLRNLPD
jgi:hypothetical protein